TPHGEKAVSRALPLLRAAIAMLACSTAKPTTAPPATMTTRQEVFISDGFSPRRGVDALKAFTPAMPAADSGGECSLSRSTGSGATTVIASFPGHVQRAMTVALTFDSTGHLVRYPETR